MGKAAQGFLILCLGICIIGAMGTLGAQSLLGSATTTECDQLKMVQPSGFLADRDQQYAEHVNQPNMNARLDCAKGEEALASATKIVAQAELIKTQADLIRNQSQNTGIAKGIPLGVLFTCFVTIVIGIVGAGLFMLLRR